MKIVNIVLSALILVLALVCTVFSFFLFQKRTEMVQGWNAMATSIAAASTNLGKPVAKDALDFKTADGSKVTATANTLVSESKKVVDQRNGLASDLQGIAKAARLKEIPEADQLIKESGSVGKEDKNSEEGEVKGAKAIARQVETTARLLDSEKAANKNLRGDMRKIADSIGAKKATRKEIVKVIEANKTELNNARNDLNSVKEELNNARTDLENAKAERDSYRNRMEDAQKEKKRAETKLKEVNAEYKKLTAEEPGKVKIWSNGSPEVRAQLRGTVKAVDPQNGYLVTDLSTATRIEQKIGKMTKEFDPQLHKGMELVVVRQKADGKLQFIARIKINRIDDKSSVANLPAQAANAIQVGDIVIDNSSYDSKSVNN